MVTTDARPKNYKPSQDPSSSIFYRQTADMVCPVTLALCLDQAHPEVTLPVPVRLRTT